MVYVQNIEYMDIMLFNWYVVYDILEKCVNGERALEKKQ